MIKDQQTAPADMTTRKAEAPRASAFFFWGDADRPQYGLTGSVFSFSCRTARAFSSWASSPRKVACGGLSISMSGVTPWPSTSWSPSARAYCPSSAARAAIRGLEQGKDEVLPGAAKLLRLMARLNPRATVRRAAAAALPH